jgi:hypothetical protein
MKPGAAAQNEQISLSAREVEETLALPGGNLLEVPALGVSERRAVWGLARAEPFLVVGHALAVVLDLGQEPVRLHPARLAAGALPRAAPRTPVNFRLWCRILLFHAPPFLKLMSELPLGD